MHDLLHVYKAHMVRTMASVHPELTLNEVRALMFVGRHPGATQKELVSHSGADKAQVARMVGMLQDKGWLESAPNAEDKRSRCLSLSAQGLALHQALREARRGVAATLLQGATAPRRPSCWPCWRRCAAVSMRWVLRGARKAGTAAGRAPGCGPRPTASHLSDSRKNVLYRWMNNTFQLYKL